MYKVKSYLINFVISKLGDELQNIWAVMPIDKAKSIQSRVNLSQFYVVDLDITSEASAFDSGGYATYEDLLEFFNLDA